MSGAESAPDAPEVAEFSQPEAVERMGFDLRGLHEILDAQQSHFQKTWDDMTSQVVQDLLHSNMATSMQKGTRTNTPTSNHSAPSASSHNSRTPPAADHRSAARHSRGRTSSGSVAQNAAPATNSVSVPKANAGPAVDDNPRERVFQMWSSLGPALKQVVDRNAQLDDENAQLRQELLRLQQQVAEKKQLMTLAQ